MIPSLILSLWLRCRVLFWIPSKCCILSLYYFCAVLMWHVPLPCRSLVPSQSPTDTGLVCSWTIESILCPEQSAPSQWQRECTEHSQSYACQLLILFYCSHCRNGTSQAGQPSDKIDWPNLKFGLMPTNAYVRYTWVRVKRSCQVSSAYRAVCADAGSSLSKQKNGSWGKAELVKEPYINLHVASVALNYGQSVSRRFWTPSHCNSVLMVLLCSALKV